MPSVFVVGAGFCVDANKMTRGHASVAARYPLVAEMWSCFDARYDIANGVEQAFLAARAQRDSGPGRCLVDLIQTADYYVGGHVARMKASPYRSLTDSFPDACFLSFNYDCLLEQILLEAKLWIPRDGFGVPAQVGEHPVAIQNTTVASRSAMRVLHLHGSIYLYPVEYDTYVMSGDETQWLRERASPQFRFDPEGLASHFLPYERVAPDIHYILPDERLVLPLPDKVQDLSQRAIRLVHAAAKAALQTASSVVSIGYSFAPSDRASYAPLLRTLRATGGVGLTLVDPNASAIAERLRQEFPGLSIEPVATTFASWAN